MWSRLRQKCPDPIKIAIRRLRSRVIDPFDRGILIEVSGTQVRAPGYFKGGGRADYEMASAVRFKQWLREHPEGLVVDVGCSVSTYGLIALSGYPGSRVIALDPDLPSLVWTRFICSKVERPSRLRLVRGFVVAEAEPPKDANAAAADTAVELEPRSANPFAEVTKYQDGNDSSNKAVPRHSIDALLRGDDCRGGLLIKIDVEGNELGVLKGAAQTLGRVAPTVLASVHPQFGVDVAEVRRFFEAAGYSCEHFATDHEEHWWCTPRSAPVS
jgi:FkbM family methyltransferase